MCGGSQATNSVLFSSVHQSSSFLSSFNSRLVLFKMARSNSATFQLGMLHTHKHKRKSCDAAGSTLSLKLGTKSDPVDLISTPTAKTDVTRSLTDRSRSLSLFWFAPIWSKRPSYIYVYWMCVGPFGREKRATAYIDGQHSVSIVHVDKQDEDISTVG